MIELGSDEARTIHLLYSALHQAHKQAPTFWTVQECTRVLTAIMAAKAFSWRVIGITPAALDALAAAGFRLKRGHGITRAHLQPRIDTVKKVMLPDEALSEREFFDIWIANDRTILCARGENKNTGIPEYLPIENDDGAFFSCHRKLAGWHHRKQERDFLKELFHEKARRGLVGPSAAERRK
jgi:hypothetical protein